MKLGYLRIKDEDMGCRVDISSMREEIGGMISFDDYSGKAAVKRGRVRFPVSSILKIEEPEEVTVP